MGGMEEYLIGAGAVLTAGPSGAISAATLHAQTQSRLAESVRAAIVDFEGSSPADLSRIVVLIAGWRSGRFANEVIRPLLARGECSLADVASTLARAAESQEVHLFARWLPDDALRAALSDRGISLVAHPLEAIGQAALVSGQRVSRWGTPFRAA